MSLQTFIQNVRHMIFPDSKLVDEGTKQINEVVNSIRHETSTMHENTKQLRKPDALWQLTQNMRSLGR